MPSHKVIQKSESDDVVGYLGEFEERWKNDAQLRERIAEDSKDFYLENFEGKISPPDPNDEDFPLSAFYWMILQKFDSQSVSSAIFADDDAKSLLREGGWFNA